MQKIPFWKMSGSGNDFLVIDGRGGNLANDWPDFARRVCRPKLSVGGDGVLLLEGSDKADFRMRIFNADGSEAEMCGNGARCMARFAHQKGIAPARMAFETLAGIVRAEVQGERVEIQMGDPQDLMLHQKILLDGAEWILHSVNIGVPHAVLCVDDLEGVPIRDLGPKIRYHASFHPAGTNVDFIRIEDPHRIVIRTYERGVEDETLACGTGSVAAALVAAALGKADSPVFLQTRGGEVLTIHFQRKPEGFAEVFLEGGTRVAYEGELWEEALR